MLITDKAKLQEFGSSHRIWQGIPGIEVTKKGRIFSAFYSGETKETVDNFVVLTQSDDGGTTFSEPIAVAFKKGGRCYDEMIWIDPLGRLWFTWSYAKVGEKEGVYATICDDPDANELVWSDVFFIGEYVLMNKPTVLSTGEWIFPIAIWRKDFCIPNVWADATNENTGAYAYKCVDKNREFVRMGGVEVSGRTFDEHMILEKQDRSLMMLVRTDYGIGVSYSYDRGHTWTEGKDSGLQGPSSRFFIKRLKSGRVLLVNHYHFQNRNNLTALLSEDDGKTFPYSLLLDERDSVTYPDGVEADDGYLYITYDRERGAFKRNIAEVKNSAREILFAKFTEEDILAGELVNKGSKLKQICSKLVGFPENCNPFEEFDYFSDLELVEILCKSEPNEIIAKLFNAYPISCVNMGQLDSEKLDSLIENMQKDQQANVQTTLEMIRLIRSVSVKDTKITPIVETVKAIIEDNFKEELSVSAVAKRVNVSEYYLMHAFKKQTGITLGEYRAALRLTHAKQLLIGTKKTVGEIASECGFFDANYFSKVFKKAEKISPVQFRNLHKK